MRAAWLNGNPYLTNMVNASGHLTARSGGSVTDTFAYDQADRLTGSTAGPSATNASYTYNGDGLRVSKTVGGTTTR